MNKQNILLQGLKNNPNTTPLTDGEIYIYTLMNDKGYIKIGKTSNPYERIVSLSGSNGGGNKIVIYYFSPPTWIHKLETICHDHFRNYRVPKTEWFYGDDLYYEDVIDYIKELFNSDSYNMINKLNENKRLL